MADRSLVDAQLTTGPDGVPWATFQCDCGLVTVIRLTGITPESSNEQVAYTCENCMSTHWFWLEIQINER